MRVEYTHTKLIPPILTQFPHSASSAAGEAAASSVASLIASVLKTVSSGAGSPQLQSVQVQSGPHEQFALPQPVLATASGSGAGAETGSGVGETGAGAGDFPGKSLAEPALSPLERRGEAAAAATPSLSLSRGACLVYLSPPR